MFLALIAILMQTISPVLAYAPQPSVPVQLTAGGMLDARSSRSNANDPLFLSRQENVLEIFHGPRATAKYWGADNVAILDVAVDASGKLQKIVVVSTPDQKGAQFAVREFTNFTYRPALKNCTAVASMFRTWYPVRSNHQRIYSIVAASYPAGWSNEHPSACRVPDLIHDGAPAIANVRTNKPLSTAVRVDVNRRGCSHECLDRHVERKLRVRRRHARSGTCCHVSA